MEREETETKTTASRGYTHKQRTCPFMPAVKQQCPLLVGDGITVLPTKTHTKSRPICFSAHSAEISH